MAKLLKRITKYFVICVPVFTILLGNISYGYTSAEVGAAAAGWAKWIIENHTTGSIDSDVELKYSQPNRDHNPFWNQNNATKYASTPWYFDCSSFCTSAYNYVTGQIILGSETWPATTASIPSESSFDDLGTYSSVGEAGLRAGDLLCQAGFHVEIYVDSTLGTAGARNSNKGLIFTGLSGESSKVYPHSATTHVYRLKESVAASVTNLNTTYSSATTSSGLTVNFSDFYFNGIPDGKYSLASTDLLSMILETLASIADYIIGILTYIIRMVVVGWTAIFDNLFNWTVNTVTDTGVEAEDLNISAVEIESSDADDRVTMEKMIYNTFDLLNINIFR